MGNDSQPIASSKRGSAPGERRGGRAKGVKDRKTIIRQELIEKVIVNGDDPLTFFLNIYKNQELPLAIRMEAAQACMPYCHRKLPQAIEHTGVKDGEPIRAKLEVEFVGAVADAIVKAASAP